MTQHNQAPRQPRGLLAPSKSRLSSSHWHVTALAPSSTPSRTDYGHMSGGQLRNPTVLWLSHGITQGKGAHGWAKTSQSAIPWCCAQAQSDPGPIARHQVPLTGKTIHSRGDHVLWVFFSPFIPWDDVTVACGETHFHDIWDISAHARNKKHYTKEERKAKLNKPRKKWKVKN